MDAKNISIAALVCGILGIVGSFIPVVQYFTLVLAILGIVFGVKGRKAEGNDKRAWPPPAWCWASSAWLPRVWLCCAPSAP